MNLKVGKWKVWSEKQKGQRLEKSEQSSKVRWTSSSRPIHMWEVLEGGERNEQREYLNK